MAQRRLPGRRALLGWPVLLALPGCGFHPLYGSNGAGAGAQQGLGLVSVGIIPDRPGQLLRQALQARFDHGDAPPAKQFDLSVSYRVSSEGLAVQEDTTVTRLRFVGRASWTLTTRDATRATVTTGSARAVDGLNMFDQQYFARDLETDTIDRIIAEAIAEQITMQLAMYFEKHPA